MEGELFLKGAIVHRKEGNTGKNAIIDFDDHYVLPMAITLISDQSKQLDPPVESLFPEQSQSISPHGDYMH